MIELVAQIHVETVVEMGVLALQRAGGCSLPKLVEELHICIANDIEGRRPNRLTIDGIPSTDLLKQGRSEEHTSELQSLMRITYAVFCLKKKTKTDKHILKSFNLIQ